MLCKYTIVAVTIVISLLVVAGAPFAQEGSSEVNIKKIEVRGCKRVSALSVKAATKIRVGDSYDAQAVGQDVDAIWSLGFFNNIEVELEPFEDGILLVFLVTERPVVRNVSFVGNSKVRTSSLEAVVEIRKGDYLRSYLKQFGEDKIRELYREKGFHFADVVSVEEESNGYVDIVFHVREGSKVFIGDIRIEGNSIFKEKKLLKLLPLKKRSFPRIVFPGIYNQDKLDEGKDRIKAFYGSGGWLDADVDAKIQFSPDRSQMYITLLIDEGDRYYVGATHVNGNKLFTDSEIQEILELAKGDPFMPETLQKDSEKIRNSYGRQGYVDTDVKVSHKYSMDKPEVDVFYDIQEKERVFIEKISISGNDKTKDNVIRRELLFYPGERLDTEKVRISQQRLVQTGFFDNESGIPTNIDYEPGSKPNTRNVLVEVKEGRTGLLRFGGGLGANVGLFADVSYTDKNFDLFDLPKSWNDFVSGNAFRGGGHVVTLRFSPGFQRTEGLFSFQNPAVFDSGYNLGLNAFIFRRSREDYDEERKGAKITVGKQVLPGLTLKLTPSYEVIGVQNVDGNAPSIINDSEGSNTKLSLELRANLDTRDDRFVPSKGYQAESSLQVACLDVDIVKFTLSAKKYKTLFDFPGWGKHILSFGGTFGMVENTTDEPVPTFERFWAGGSGSIRGFSFRGVGNIDPETTEQVGGEVLMLGSIEYTMPVYTDMARGAFFIDAGKTDSDVTDINLNNMRASVGFGVRMRVPFLGNSVISVDFGIPLIRKSEDDTQTITFNFGGSGF
ncbi:MAG: outer membrane protein assembly factor BamA [Candidatus Scalindua sp. AMX11]|nr:MAG: outer membrane protein assembly factor BamA [Candidatus Scalindua sp.]NOG85277.1 outer membrane protein assembly factor BamA [Planctomycetota bacterium]RZV81504.1 MAG: outer membrane protein assembly factor BamA [Candidatus Scalindua sp. SCAELEC01]TDE65423.1 MAG: outer membrane protein assembly factor BamA [Candidatus Scalindua sp. AMX11]GJQ59345.1 MAG: outer membrane protein assembly factor BamA [Candidatus Scalindua sp.]